MTNLNNKAKLWLKLNLPEKYNDEKLVESLSDLLLEVFEEGMDNAGSS